MSHRCYGGRPMTAAIVDRFDRGHEQRCGRKTWAVGDLGSPKLLAEATVVGMARSLAETHPFLNFDFDTARVDAATWLRLGESLSKCQHLAGVPLKPSAAYNLAQVYLARGIQATTAIEGNTLSDAEVLKVVKTGSADVSPSRAYLQTEVANILAAVEQIDASLKHGVRMPITAQRLNELNQQVLVGVPDRPEVVPGVTRRHDVTVGSAYTPPHWTEVDPLVNQLTAWLDKTMSAVGAHSSTDEKLVTSVLCAILAHVYIAWIHPWGNGNGRTARLVEVQILSESGVVPIVATNLLSDHYNKTRDAYYLALNAAQHDLMAFVRYAVQGFADELRDQIATVREENLTVHWESYVYEIFRGLPRTEARDRQRDVALAMPEGRLMTPEEVTDLSPRIARMFAVCGERTPARDMNTLAKEGLVVKVGRRYRVRRDLIQAFLPPVSNDQ